MPEIRSVFPPKRCLSPAFGFIVDPNRDLIRKEAQSYTVPAAKRPFTYDDDGNMLTGHGWTYTWNGENRLVRAVKDGVDIAFTYDYAGRRSSKTVSDAVTVTAQTVYVYNQFQLTEERDGLNGNALLRRYTWDPALGTPAWVYDAALDTTYYYQTDANRNVAALVDGAGNAVAEYVYTPFGELLLHSGSYALTNPLRFSSEYYDGDLELVYYNYRYYHPGLGRWLSRDPIGIAGGLNLYAMVGNDPVNLIDMLGLLEYNIFVHPYQAMYGGVINMGYSKPHSVSLDPKLSATSAKIIKRLLGRITRGMITPFNIGVVQNWWTSSDPLIIEDEEKELECLMGFMRFVVRDDIAQRELLSDWTPYAIDKFNAAPEYTTEGYFTLGASPLLTTGWWLGSSSLVNISGNYEAKYEGGMIYYRNATFDYEWYDDIDGNSFIEAYRKGAFGASWGSFASNVLEGLYDLYADKTLGADYKIIVRGKTDIPDMGYPRPIGRTK